MTTTPHDRFIHAVDLQQALKKLRTKYYQLCSSTFAADFVIERAETQLELIDDLAEALELDIK